MTGEPGRMALGGGQRPTLPQLVMHQFDLGRVPALLLQLDPNHLPLPLGKELTGPPGAASPW